jgi:hypothetical protein
MIENIYMYATLLILIFLILLTPPSNNPILIYTWIYFFFHHGFIYFMNFHDHLFSSHRHPTSIHQFGVLGLPDISVSVQIAT